LLLYMSSYLLAYFPAAGALALMAKAKADMQTDLVDSFVAAGKGRVSWWSDKEKKKAASTLLTGEAPTVISTYLDYIYYFGQSVILVSLNLFALGVIVEPLLVVSYFVGLALAILILILQRRGKIRLALKAQQARLKWLSVVMTAWDNVVLNNAHNFQIWQSQVQRRSERYRQKALHLGIFTQLISILMSFSLFLPTLGLLLTLALMRSTEYAWLAVAIVTLPRLSEVLTCSYEALYYFADHPQQKAQLGTVMALLDHADHDPITMLQRVSWDKITVMGPGGSCPVAEHFWKLLPSNGRYILTGANGAGKSSLLQHLKALRTDEAYYLPTQHELLFKLGGKNSSTGEKIKSTLGEIFARSKASIFLLDEWDASLDADNRREIDLILDELSKTYCILESRHFN
ncbi:MAG: hypothetical protein KDK48_05485, partial [Chlamydiia bacterium]|nr:hypothetical protein [Chlamydiia bacterium]